MGTKNPKIDAYIAKSAEFARPILTHLRKMVHAACLEVEEDMKWGHPFFSYKGTLCAMPAFKEHCRFGFWKWKLVQAEVNKAAGNEDNSIERFGKITSLNDLPEDKILIGYIRIAAGLNEAGKKMPAKPKSKIKAKLTVPASLKAALKKNKKAQEAFENFSYSHKKEYIEWINDAKAEATRDRRLAQAMEWLTEGKSRNWKYQNC